MLVSLTTSMAPLVIHNNGTPGGIFTPDNGPPDRRSGVGASFGEELVPERGLGRLGLRQILLRILVELLLARLGAEIVVLAVVGALRRGLSGLHVHSADRIDCHRSLLSSAAKT